MRLAFLPALCLLLCPASNTVADSPVVAAEDPYEVIYAEQATLAHIEIEKHDVHAEFNRKRLERLEGLSGGSLPTSTVHEARRQVELDDIHRRALESRERRALAQLAIARHRLAKGQDVSVCGDLD